MINIKDYPYLYETHIHTNQSSACGFNTGYEMAKAAHEAGYAGIIITDHHWNGNTCVPRNCPWNEWMHKFAGGYLDAKRYGDENDFDVFFGYESNYGGTEFLIYGPSVEWLADHPEIEHASIEEQFHIIHEAGGIVIHAHPFREDWYLPEIRLFPDLVDGVEAINAQHSCLRSDNHYDPDFDRKAVAYAHKHNLPLTAGSDRHLLPLLGGGMAFKRRLSSIQDFCQIVLSDEDYLLTDGDSYYDKKGQKL